MERVDTRLLQSDIDKVSELAKKEDRSQSAMMRKLILEAIEARDSRNNYPLPASFYEAHKNKLK